MVQDWFIVMGADYVFARTLFERIFVEFLCVLIYHCVNGGRRAAGVALAERPKRKRRRSPQGEQTQGSSQGDRVPVADEAAAARAAGLRTPSAPDAARVNQATVARGGGNIISGGHTHLAGANRKPSGEGTAEPVTGGAYGQGVTGW